MRILHAIHDFLPRHHAGSEIYAFELGRELARRHHVTVLCAEYDLARPHGRVAWRVHRGLPVVEIVNNWTCASFAETYRPELVGRRVSQALHAVQPDVVHIHNLLNLSFDLPARARAAGVPVVATLHDYTLVCPVGGQRVHHAEQHVCRVIEPARCARCVRESPIYAQISVGNMAGRRPMPRWLHRLGQRARRAPGVANRLGWLASKAAAMRVNEADVGDRLLAARQVFDQVDLFVAPSASMAGEFERLGVARSKMRVSGYGIPPLVPRPRQSLRGPLRIGYVGTLVWHKGVHVLVEAVRTLPRASYELKIFGDPDMFPEYAADLSTRAGGLPVRFMGRFERDRTADVYAEMDVLVVPSLWLENSPLVIHEAFLAGVPVIGARIGGIEDLIQDGQNGALFEPGSPEALAAVLRELMDSERRAALVARKPVIKSISQDASEWEAIYTDAIERRASSAH